MEYPEMVVSVGKMMISKFRGTPWSHPIETYWNPSTSRDREPKRAREVFETKCQAEVELTIREMRWSRTDFGYWYEFPLGFQGG
jgi:hypothetical protein